jgi:hypothetical protein
MGEEPFLLNPLNILLMDSNTKFTPNRPILPEKSPIFKISLYFDDGVLGAYGSPI